MKSNQRQREIVVAESAIEQIAAPLLLIPQNHAPKQPTNGMNMNSKSNLAVSSILAMLAIAARLSAQAGVAPFPYTTSFEGALDSNYWTVQGSWGLTTEAAHTGVNSLTDSPGTIYNNNVDDGPAN